MATTADDGEHATDTRLTVLETRFDTVLPTLATKADVAELRADIVAFWTRFESVLPTLATKNDLAQLRGEMYKWIAATMITLFLGFGGMLYTMLTYLRPA